MLPTIGNGAISVALSVRLPVYLSVCSSVAYIATNSRTQSPSVPKFGMKVPHLRCESHTSFKVKRSKVRVTDGRGHTVSATPRSDNGCTPSQWYPQIRSWSVMSAARRLAVAGRSRTCAVQARRNSAPVSATQGPAVPKPD